MTPPSALLSLPPYTFIMSNHATRELACSLAEELGKDAIGVFIDDFLAPIHNALAAMFDVDWKTDLATSPVIVPNHDTGDLIKDLEAWFTSQFGEEKLGQLALARSKEARETYEYSFVFRDATPSDVSAFLQDTSIARRDMLIVNLHKYPLTISTVTCVHVSPSADAPHIVGQIRQVL